MTPSRIKKVRERLSLTQDELATILGVTKTTVWRYEDGRAAPGDDVAAKILNLEASLDNPDERKQLKALRKTPGGVAAITAVAAMGAALFSGAAAAGAGATGCAGIAASPAGKSLFSFLQTLLGGPMVTAALGGGAIATGGLGAVAVHAKSKGKPAKGDVPKSNQAGDSKTQDADNVQYGGNYEI